MTRNEEAEANRRIAAWADAQVARNTRFTGSLTEPIFDPEFPNPEDWIGLAVTEYENGIETDRYISLRGTDYRRPDGTHTATGSVIGYTDLD